MRSTAVQKRDGDTDTDAAGKGEDENHTGYRAVDGVTKYSP
jgi:hypothetical protein